MAGGVWDGSLKRLITANPQHFISWLLPEAQLLHEVPEHLNRAIDADLLYAVAYHDYPILCHIEIQRRRDPKMARRAWEYNTVITCKYNQLTWSFILYLKKESNIEDSPMVLRVPNGGPEIHRFHYVNVKLWEVPTESLRDLGSFGLLPLLPLTREGGKPDVVEEVITEINGLQDLKMRNDLLTISMTLASLALDKQSDREWLRRRFLMYQDILHDTEIYQLIMQEGLEKGVQQGLEKGVQQGLEKGVQQAEQQEIQDLRQLLLDFVRARFVALLPFATTAVEHISNKDVLQRLILAVGTARDAQEAQEILSHAL